MVGMEPIADQFNELVAETMYKQRRAEAGLKVPDTSNHLVFEGPPGTGKTTVAREFARAYHALGVVPKDTFKDYKASDLIGQYDNQIEQHAHEKFMAAKGGVLLVDEAYTLNETKYGRRVLTQLMQDAEDNRNDTVVILAGYAEDMAKMKAANPGMPSRFPRSITFPGYDEGQLRKIMSGMLREHGYRGTPGTSAALDQMAAQIAATPGHGQARDVRNAFEAVVREHARNVAGKPDADLARLSPEDVQGAMRRFRVSSHVRGSGTLEPTAPVKRPRGRPRKQVASEEA